MKIVRLSASNIKRLTAVEIKPDGSLVTISGKNGAGKSSVLDAIAYALGGAKLVPSEPIRKGQSEASVEADLGEMVVTRKFKRADNGTTSTLVVRSKEGLIFPSPQAVLDKLLGKLTFDPLAFVDDKNQAETLRKLVGLDTTEIDRERKTEYDNRTLKKRELQSAQTILKTKPQYEGVGTELLSMDEVSAEMLKAERARRAVEEARRGFETISGVVKMWQRNIAVYDSQIERLKNELLTQERLKKETQESLDEQLVRRGVIEGEIKKAEAAIPDTENLHRRITEIEGYNNKVRVNQEHERASAIVANLEHEIEEADEAIAVLDLAKQKALEDVAFPVEGLGFNDAGEVTFNGVEFSEASRAEQLRVSVAIGLALNPKLRVLLIKEGSALDSESLAIVAEQAKWNDAQVWVERVADADTGVGVFIEDGGIA